MDFYTIFCHDVHVMRILFYIFSFLFGTIVFISLFSTPLFANIDILFYRGIILLFISCIGTALLSLFVMKKVARNKFDARDVVVTICIIFSLNLVFFTLVPVTVDRSVTVFILQEIGKNRNVTKEQMQKDLYTDYIVRQKAVERRFYEQQKSGTVAKGKKGYFLTPQGESLLSSFAVIRTLFHIKQ